MRKVQIGVIGSMADLQYKAGTEQTEQLAKELGETIAAAGYVLIFGAEKDSDSLPTVAAVACRQSGGLTIGITYEKGTKIYDQDSASVVIATGLVRGGGREMVQALSCDGIIALAGGSGTLNEITVAYQAGIPVVMVRGFGGWSEELKGQYLDARQRYRFGSATTAKRALRQLETMIQSRERKQ